MNTSFLEQSLVQSAPSASSFDIGAIYTAYHDRIYRYIAYLVGREQADDLTQDVFVRVVRALPTMPEDLRLSPWLYRIAHNIACDALRRRRRVAWQSLEDVDGELASGSADDPQAACVQAELVRLALARIPTPYQQALLLYEERGYSYAQIAQTLHLAPGGVKMCLSRARRAFQQHYRELEREVIHVI